MEKERITSFTDLKAWKEGHILVLGVYRETKNFPKEEMFGLVSQMRRCAVSVTSNISEGFSRKSRKEKVQFYRISLGSLTELQNQLLISKDIEYLPKEAFKKIANQTVVVKKLLHGIIKSAM